MLISMAYAQDVVAESAAIIEEAPSAANAFAWNMGLIAILVVMFYVLLIRPQQKRFSEHRDMLGALKKGDKIVTSGGLVGKIDKMGKEDDEVIVDLGNGMKVTALRSTIQSKSDKTPATSKKDTSKKAAKKK